MASGEVIWPIPMKAIGAQNLLTMPGGVTVSGYLHKRGGKQLQLFKWPLRYVIIHKGCVYYFKTSTSASSQGAFSLNGYNRVMRAAEETTSSTVFPFKMVHISKKHRTWYFSAASEEERKKWMLALRKEIDFYHEKKETITDLSDTGSDTDSFYGSVERPVDIKYTHSSAEDSWQAEDEDEDDDEDYVQPDGVDDSAPAYPPPPVPRQSKLTEEVPKRSSVPTNFGPPKPPPPIPPSKMVTTELNLMRSRKEFSIQHYSLSQPDEKPPPIPPYPPAHKGGGLPPLPPPKNITTDLQPKELARPRKELSSFPVSSDLKPLSLPLQAVSSRVEPPVLPRPNIDFTNCHQQTSSGGYNLLNRELNLKFNNPPPPPVPSHKPNHLSAPAPPVKPVFPMPRSSISEAPPIPTSKPKLLMATERSPEISPAMVKPGLVKPRTIVKHPALPLLNAKLLESHKPGPSPILRSPPDGQSFRDMTMESPVRPGKSKYLDDNNDSDEDYEKVPLPASVFVDTFDSFEVERMFKARGSPLNGLFCIRNSAKAGKVLVVWDSLESKTRNYRIFEKDSKVYLEGELLFPDIGTLVEHYYSNTLPSHNSLLLKYAYGCSIHPR